MSCLLDIQLAVRCRQADFLCRDDAIHSWFLSLSFSLYEYTDMFQGNNEAKINLPTSTVKVSVKACSLHIHHYPCFDLKSISFDHWYLITFTSHSQRPCAVVWLMRKATFGVTLWSSTQWCVNRWVRRAAKWDDGFQKVLGRRNMSNSFWDQFPDVQVRHHGCVCG